MRTGDTRGWSDDWHWGAGPDCVSWMTVGSRPSCGAFKVLVGPAEGKPPADDRLRRDHGARWTYGLDLVEDGNMQDRTNKPSDNQVAQRELVAQGLNLPGVAEFLDAYNKRAKYATVLVNVSYTQIRNATGGNST